MCWSTSTLDRSIFVRNGTQPVGPFVVDFRLLAVMTYAPKTGLLDEIFDANQGAGEGQFSCVQIFMTKDTCRVYQAESPRGPSNVWLPYDPRFMAGTDDETTQRMITATIPRGTVVGVGLVGNETRWYIPSKHKGKVPIDRMPHTWSRETPAAFNSTIFVRNGSQASRPFIVDDSLLAPLTYGPKTEILDEIFGANQGTGEEQFSRAQIFTTKDTCRVYQAELPTGLSKIWLPYDPRLMAGIGGDTTRPMIRATIPKGTVVGVGLVGDETRWYIPSTYKGEGASKQVPRNWRLETLATASAPPGSPPRPVSA